MKRLKMLLLAVVVLATASAFTTQAPAKTGDLYYADYSIGGGHFRWVLIEGSVGTCTEDEEVFCKGLFDDQPADDTPPPNPEENTGEYIAP